MKVETMADVMEWTRGVHSNIAECLEHCSEGSRRERVRMLLDYLSEHERELDRVLRLSEEDASKQALNTWCYDYFEKAPVKPHERCDQDFSDQDTGDIIADVMAMHEKVVDLYRYMASRAEVPSTRELMESLCDLEEHEAMRMARDAARMEDL